MITFRTKYASDAPRVGLTLSPGFYQARIVDVYEDYNEKLSKDFVFLELDVQDGSAASITLKDWIYIENNTLWRVEQLLAATGKKFAAGEEIQFDARKLNGRQVTIATYKHRDDAGKVYARVLAYLRPEDVPHMGAMTPEDLAAFRLMPDGTKVPRNAPQPAQQRPQATAYRQPAQQGYARPQRQSYAAPQGYAATHNGEQDLADEDLPF